MYDVEKLRFWCQKIIPLVYEDSLSYYELLCKVVHKLNELVDNVNDIPEYISQLISVEGLQEIMRTLLVTLERQIANANEGESETATSDRAVGTLVWLNGYLYRATKFIDAGDRYVVNGNIEKITIEEVIKGVMLALTDNYEDGERVASEDREAGELVWFKNQLLYIKQNIAEGNAYTDSNSEVVDFSKLFQTIHNEIVSETTARVNADTALGTRIDNEATARENADTALGVRIDNEATARENADTALGDRIDDEATARENADTAIGERISFIEDGEPWVTPEMYGAVGDGETDDTVSVQSAFDNVPIHGVVLMKKCYKITAPIEIKKPLSVNGAYNGFDVEEHTDYVTLEEYRRPTIIAYDIAFIVNSVGVKIENICITSYASTSVIYYKSLADINSPTAVARNNTLRNVMIFGADAPQYGVTSEDDIITSTFDQVRIYSCQNGFYFGKADGKSVTSLVFSNCWVINATNVGYQLINAHYCSFISCACDTVNASLQIGYDFEHCDTISMLSCGVEGTNLAGVRAQVSKNIHISVYGYNVNHSQSASGGLVICDESSVDLSDCYVSGDLSLTSNRIVVCTGDDTLNHVTVKNSHYRYINLYRLGDYDNADRDYIGVLVRRVTVTTGNLGEASTGLSYATYIPLNIYSHRAGVIVSTYYGGTNEIIVRVTDNVGNAMANTSVELYFVLLERDNVIDV